VKLTEINQHLNIHNDFCSRVEAVGFIKGPGTLWFHRNREPFIDVFAFWVSGTGNFLEAPVACFKRELVDYCEMEKIPKGFASSMPIHSEMKLSNSKKSLDRTRSPWRNKDKAELQSTLKELIEIIETTVDHWFLDIDSDIKYFENFPPYAQGDEYGLNIKSKLNLKVIVRPKPTFAIMLCNTGFGMRVR